MIMRQHDGKNCKYWFIIKNGIKYAQICKYVNTDVYKS